MPVFQKTFRVKTQGRCQVLDVTSEVNRIVGARRIRQGIVNVAGKGSTLGITTIE